MSENESEPQVIQNDVEPVETVEELKVPSKQRGSRKSSKADHMSVQEAELILKGFTEKDDVPEGRRSTRSSTRGATAPISTPPPVKKEKRASTTAGGGSGRRGRPKKVDNVTLEEKEDSIDGGEKIDEETKVNGDDGAGSNSKAPESVSSEDNSVDDDTKPQEVIPPSNGDSEDQSANNGDSIITDAKESKPAQQVDSNKVEENSCPLLEKNPLENSVDKSSVKEKLSVCDEKLSDEVPMESASAETNLVKTD